MWSSKDQWVIACERLAEALGEGEIDEHEFRERMEGLGWTSKEIDRRVEDIRADYA